MARQKAGGACTSRDYEIVLRDQILRSFYRVVVLANLCLSIRVSLIADPVLQSCIANANELLDRVAIPEKRDSHDFLLGCRVFDRIDT